MTNARTDVNERWADRVRAFTAVDTCSGEIGRDLCPPLPDVFGVRDLEKTDVETAAIAEAVEAVRDYCVGLADVDPGPFPPARVHMLEEREFQDKVGKGRASGKSWLGHVYLERRWPTGVLQALLAHELLHNASYLWLDMHSYAGPTSHGMRIPKLLHRRNGMVLIDPSYGTLLPHFHGLNEAVTETAAIFVRRMIASRSLLLDDAQRAQLTSFIANPPLVVLLDRLVQLAKGSGGDTVTVWRTLMKDYLTGTDDFLLLLEPHLPGATERLRRTGAQPHEVLPAAEELGLDDIADQIRPYVG